MKTMVRLGGIAAVGVVMAALVLGCAARGARDTARVGAVTFSHLAHDVKVTEDSIYAAHVPGYDKDVHLKVQQSVRKVLVAASAYDTAVRDWPAGAKATDAVIASQHALGQAIQELSQAIPAVVAVQEPLLRAIKALAAALASQSDFRLDVADGRLGAVQFAQLPGGGVLGLLSLLQIAISLFQQGKMTFADLAGFLKASGASDEELAAAKALVDADIADIDTEAARG